MITHIKLFVFNPAGDLLTGAPAKEYAYQGTAPIPHTGEFVYYGPNKLEVVKVAVAYTKDIVFVELYAQYSKEDWKSFKN